MAEQFRFDKFVRYRGTVHFHKRPRVSLAEPLDRFRHEFFSRAVLPRDEDADIGRRHPLDDREHFAHLRTAAEDNVLPFHRLPHPVVLCEQSMLFRSVPYGDDEFVAVQRFGKEIVCSQASRLHRRFDRPVPRDHDHRKVRALLPDLAQDFQAVLPRHFDIEEDCLHCMIPQTFESHDAVFCKGHVELLVLEDHLD